MNETNNKIQIFANEEFGQIRTVEINGEPWFVGKDVAEALGYKEATKAAREKVDSEDRGKSKIDTPSGTQNMTIINESGLYSLIFASKLPTAKKFKRWVTSEVLPTIRRHGMYAMDELLNNPDFAIEVFSQLKAERERNNALQLEIAQSRQMSAEPQPKTSYYDIILVDRGLVTITQIAKDYGTSGKKLNELLHTYGVLFNRGGQWFLYSRHRDKGYTHSKTADIKRSGGRTGVGTEIKWTQKGRLFIYELLKKNGMLPVIEQKATA